MRLKNFLFLLVFCPVALALFAQEPAGTREPAAAAPAKRPKHVFTNDDINSSSGGTTSAATDVLPDLRSTYDAAAQYFPKNPITAKDVEGMHNNCHGIVYNGRTRTKESLGKEYLTDQKNAPFAGRAEWEARLFEAHQEIVKATEEYDVKLQALAAENRELLTLERFTDDDLQKVRALRVRLIDEWQLVRGLTAKFAAIVLEGRHEAEHWLKTHPQPE